VTEACGTVTEVSGTVTEACGTVIEVSGTVTEVSGTVRGISQHFSFPVSIIPPMSDTLSSITESTLS
jgi:hypothetical protein